MTYEEAKARVLAMCNTKTDEDADAVMLVVRACNKQIRQRPVRSRRTKSDDLFCPVCAAKVGWRNVKFSKQARYCAECAAVLSDPRSARMKKALPKTADGMKLTIENVVELCRHYRAPYSSYGQMMSYLTQYHAMPPKEYRR